jgi:hypothetical protein
MLLKVLAVGYDKKARKKKEKKKKGKGREEEKRSTGAMVKKERERLRLHQPTGLCPSQTKASQAIPAAKRPAKGQAAQQRRKH